MYSLEGGESFSNCQLDTYDGIGALIGPTEDSLKEHIHRQIQRFDEAQRREKTVPDKHDQTREIEKVEITISEDYGDGHLKALDATLNLLFADELEPLVPSNELEDEEAHLIETTFEDSTAKGQAPLENHQLQDYQMQLMLLEQQNKKRLLMARQEQDTENFSTGRMHDGGYGPGGFPRHTHFHNPMNNYDLGRFDRSRGTPVMPGQDGRADSSHIMKKRKMGQWSDTQSEVDENNELMKSTHNHVQQGASSLDMPPHCRLLYMVSCKDRYQSAAHHIAPAFLDPPISTGPRLAEDSDPQYSHLNGTAPLLDLEGFMEDDLDEVAFVVIRTVECSPTAVMMVRAGIPLRWTEQIYTKSKALKSLLHEIASCYFQPVPDTNPKSIYPGYPYNQPNSPNSKFDHQQISPPDLFLFHHRSLLLDYPLKHPEYKVHADSLLQYMEAHHGTDFVEADQLFARGEVSQAHILKLFKPNDLVVSGTCGRPAAFVIQEWPKSDSSGWVTLVCWSFQTEGPGFTRKRSVLSIPPIETEVVRINTLPAYPLQFSTPEVKEYIQRNGKLQWELRIATQITYRGRNVKGDQSFTDARFMIDHSIYRKMHENAAVFHFDRPTTTHPYDRMPTKLFTEQTPSDISLLLMQPDIYGFYLNEKKWIRLFVDCIHPVSWNTKAYERLVLPPRTKELIRALVSVRASQKGVKQGIGIAGKRTDITMGKGNGLIMLLHGGPGTGKTLTAESVAEIAKMPLYRVTCGDIGTNAEAVEKYLNTVLHLGKAWNCMLLLDEADIFLEERSMSDLKRNSLVSVFLRVLEYYDGILILTSNRVGMFDEAFKSRIQVALHYENLNLSARKKIWQNFIEMLEEDEEDVNFDEIRFHIDDLAGKELNGRQIRNALTTARQLAIFRNERLDWDHLTQALSVSTDFSAYLKRMQGHTDDQRARDNHLR